MDVLIGHYDVFLIRLLRLVYALLEGQVVTKPHLVGLLVNNEAEYRVDEIRD